MLFNIPQGRFEADLIKDLRLAQMQFPEPAFADRLVGRLTRSAAGEVGLKEGLPVILGSSDGTTAMFGGGIYEKDKAVLVSGTTDVLMTLTDTYPDVPDPALTINSGPEPDLFLCGGATGLSGGTVRRFEHLFNCAVDELEPQMEKLPPGSNGLLVLPGLTGERAPYWRESTRGDICGLNLKHGPENIFNALIEATGFRIRRLIKALETSGLKVNAVKATGGLSGNNHVNRVRSNITGLEIIRMAQLESTCLGTAAFCKSALTGGGSVLDITSEWVREDRCFAPDLELTKKYAVLTKLFERHLETFENLHRDIEALR
jgi:xylulokinase